MQHRLVGEATVWATTVWAKQSACLRKRNPCFWKWNPCFWKWNPCFWKWNPCFWKRNPCFWKRNPCFWSIFFWKRQTSSSTTRTIRTIFFWKRQSSCFWKKTTSKWIHRRCFQLKGKQRRGHGPNRNQN
jgi:hypothetical protein